MRLLAAIHPPEATQATLTCLAPPRALRPGAARIDDASEEAPDPPFDVEAEFGAWTGNGCHGHRAGADHRASQLPARLSTGTAPLARDLERFPG